MNLEDVYDESIVKFFNQLMSIIGFCGVFLNFAVILIVHFKSPKSMKKFKKYLLLYLFCNFCIELLALLYKPIGISAYVIIYPQGFLSPMNAQLSKTLLTLIIIFLAGFAACFLMMLIDRYFALSNFLTENPKFYKDPNVYFLIFGIILFIVDFGIVYIINFTTFIQSPEKTSEIIMKYIIGGEKLLKFQPNLISANLECFSTIFYFILPFATIYLLLLYLSLIKHLQPSYQSAKMMNQFPELRPHCQYPKLKNWCDNRQKPNIPKTVYKDIGKMNLINQGMEEFPNVPKLILKRPKILKVDDTIIREHVTIEEVHPKYKL
uniref:Uncharacterized protein n=1 Tax=Panagrolaimus sp. JU765 TaxID=591449 RepID=A0AC34Q3U2_9BILA